MRFPAALVVLALGMATVAAAQAVDQNTASWEYQGKRGELVWSKLDPAYQACNKGHEQSPIDIRGAHMNKALAPIEFHYMAGPVTMENNGHTIEVHVTPGSYIVTGGVRYELLQFHFHHPSEEAVRGKMTDLSVHLVHKSVDGKLVVIAVRMRVEDGSPNAVLAMLCGRICPRKAGTSRKRLTGDGEARAGFLPADRGYWTYMGSLTTPPCTEGSALVCL
jgi:carbonic anhydrase